MSCCHERGRAVVIPFTKMVGAGNDFLIIDIRRRARKTASGRWRAVSRAICDRRRGIGADGLLVLEPSRVAHARMRVFNPDGSEAEMCGNGARCVAQYLSGGREGAGSKRGGRRVSIETAAGGLSAMVRGCSVAMRMPDPTEVRPEVWLRIEGRRLRAGFINTGVPHLVVPVEAIESIDVDRLGRRLRWRAEFLPRGTNVDFVQPDAAYPDLLHVRTYERGVEGETLACGTGAAASAIIHALSSHRRMRGFDGAAQSMGRHRTRVRTRSGDVLRVSFALGRGARSRPVSEVVLQGPARRIAVGTVPWPLRRFPCR